MIVLGIKAGGHDTGAAILREYRGGLNIVAIAEERLNRCKHSRQYPLMAIDYCLNAFGLKSVSYWFTMARRRKTRISFERGAQS